MKRKELQKIIQKTNVRVFGSPSKGRIVFDTDEGKYVVPVWIKLEGDEKEETTPICASCFRKKMRGFWAE